MYGASARQEGGRVSHSADILRTGGVGASFRDFVRTFFMDCHKA